MRRRALAAAVAGVVALGAAGCTTLDNAIARISWFTTMSDQVVVRPFELPRTPPPGMTGCFPFTTLSRG